MARRPEELAWVRYELGGALLALAEVSPAAELAHRRLAEHYWRRGVWPGVKSGQAPIVGRVPLRQWPDVERELKRLGWRQRGTKLFNPRTLHTRSEAILYLRHRRAGGRARAQQRWTGPKATSEPDSSAIAQLQLSSSSGVASTSKSTSNSTIKPDKALNRAERLKGTPRARAEDLALSPSAPKKAETEENAFLEQVREILTPNGARTAAAELANWGGWWRNRFRANPAKARRVAAELRGMIRERRVLQNPGAAAMDLWKRLPG